MLKTPDAPLDDDLLRRTYEASDWEHPALMLRRVLPPLTRGLTAGTVDPSGGHLFAHRNWHDWPAEERSAVQDFLESWWSHTLTEPAARVRPGKALDLLAEATGTRAPCLAAWTEALGRSAVARARLASSSIDVFVVTPGCAVVVGEDLRVRPLLLCAPICTPWLARRYPFCRLGMWGGWMVADAGPVSSLAVFAQVVVRRLVPP